MDIPSPVNSQDIVKYENEIALVKFSHTYADNSILHCSSLLSSRSSTDVEIEMEFSADVIRRVFKTSGELSPS